MPHLVYFRANESNLWMEENLQNVQKSKIVGDNIDDDNYSDDENIVRGKRHSDQ